MPPIRKCPICSTGSIKDPSAGDTLAFLASMPISPGRTLRFFGNLVDDIFSGLSDKSGTTVKCLSCGKVFTDCPHCDGLTKYEGIPSLNERVQCSHCSENFRLQVLVE